MTDYQGFEVPYNIVQPGEMVAMPGFKIDNYNVAPATADHYPSYIPEGFGSPIITYYKMRALKDPFGTGFVSWLVMNNPDPDGDQAPETIVPGSAVIMASWTG